MDGYMDMDGCVDMDVCMDMDACIHGWVHGCALVFGGREREEQMRSDLCGQDLEPG